MEKLEINDIISLRFSKRTFVIKHIHYVAMPNEKIEARARLLEIDKCTFEEIPYNGLWISTLINDGEFIKEGKYFTCEECDKLIELCECEEE